MLQQTLHVTYADGTEFDVTVGLGEYMALEDKFNIGINDYAKNPRMTYLAFLAWRGAARMHKAGTHPGAFKASWEGFREHCVGIEPVGDDVPLDETA